MTKCNKTPKSPAKENGRKAEAVCCMDCFWANLLQYGDHDPVLAECRQKPQMFNARFPYEVEVARAKRLCAMHQLQDRSEKTVQKRLKVKHGYKAA